MGLLSADANAAPVVKAKRYGKRLPWIDAPTYSHMAYCPLCGEIACILPYGQKAVQWWEHCGQMWLIVPSDAWHKRRKLTP